MQKRLTVTIFFIVALTVSLGISVVSSNSNTRNSPPTPINPGMTTPMPTSMTTPKPSEAPTVTPTPCNPGVQAGDYFKYSIKSYYQATSSNASMTVGLNIYNATDYYLITVTAVYGSSVSMQCDWKFLNGTVTSSNQTIDVASGNKTDPYGFWAVYPASLTKGDLLRPQGFDTQTVKETDAATYKNETRDRCYWGVRNEFYNTEDPTHTTLMYDYRDIFFDRKTGMLTSLTNYDVYSNPQKTETITWILAQTNVWEA